MNYLQVNFQKNKDIKTNTTNNQLVKNQNQQSKCIFYTIIFLALFSGSFPGSFPNLSTEYLEILKSEHSNSA